MGCSSSAPRSDGEKFVKELVDSAMGGETGTTDVRALTMCMWKLRDEPKVVEMLSDIIALHTDEKATFDAIEFYLPQLAHMIVHLEVDWPSSSLENFALVIAQHSLHFALQLSWFLIGCMEDYEPENEEGQINPNANPILYLRCANLLHHVERCVVYGTPHEPELRQLYMDANATPEEVREAALADRRFHAAQVANDDSPESTKWTKEGILGYKRWVRKHKSFTKGWRMRMFKVRHRVLLCFRVSDGTLKRAIPLQHTTVEVKKAPNAQILFRAQRIKAKESVQAVRVIAGRYGCVDQKSLREEAAAPPPSSSLFDDSELTVSQIARYGFYKSERDFVRSLCDICEDMRFVDRPKRKVMLKKLMHGLQIPGCVYLPLCRSTDQWRRVISVLPRKRTRFPRRNVAPASWRSRPRPRRIKK